MRPLIGITPDEGLSPGRPGRPPVPRYELKRAYPDSVTSAGGIPVVLPFLDDDDVIARVLDGLQGLVVTGGAFDIAPEEYGETVRAGMGPVKPQRTRFERRILELALSRGTPVLGICGGMQLLNVVLGGTLVQDIRTEQPDAMDHEQQTDPAGPGHEVDVVEGSLLARLAGAGRLGVNTTHHQAVAKLGRDLVVSARATDGVVEAIERPGAFCVGVQWHPELLADARNQGIYRGFVEEASR